MVNDSSKVALKVESRVSLWGHSYRIPFALISTLVYMLSNATLLFEFVSLFHYWILICYDCKNGPNLGPINLEKVICSTGFYSPPVMKSEVYKPSQLSMESFAAESRRFGDQKWPKKTKIWPYFGQFGHRWPWRTFAGRYSNKKIRQTCV